MQGCARVKLERASMHRHISVVVAAIGWFIVFHVGTSFIKLHATISLNYGVLLNVIMERSNFNKLWTSNNMKHDLDIEIVNKRIQKRKTCSC
jgi:hypothetical protein